jgi:hypothetical protein
VDPSINQCLDFIEENSWIDNNSVAYHCDSMRLNYSRWDQMKLEDLLADANGVTSIIPTVKPSDIFRLSCQQINESTFPFIPPLCANDDV